MDNNYAGDNPEKRRDVSVTELFAVPNFEHWGPYNDTGHGDGGQTPFQVISRSHMQQSRFQNDVDLYSWCFTSARRPSFRILDVCLRKRVRPALPTRETRQE